MEGDRETSRVEVYLDGDSEPIGVYRPPARFRLDTEQLDDGEHELKIVATDRSGHRGVRTLRFQVRNGPGIAVDGLKDGDVVEGEVSLLVNAYGGAYEENWEPARAETPAPIPTWAWVLFLGVVAWAMFYAAQTWSPPGEMASSPTYAAWSGETGRAGGTGGTAGEGTGSAAASTGAALYRTSCASCHQTNGQGVEGAFPPLAGDPVVTAEDPTRHVEIVLFGMQGEPIDGVEYPTPMPAWAEQLSNEEVAAVVNHERTSWGNDAPTVTAAEVAEIRRAAVDTGGGQ
jgi:mono/diheme cytochrome c family protein